ncbi:hypothetical protein RMATCC62417_10679 [Rhizopus microsporus]|nr:hypothetical protein RMATCC62417_10679 [Rhizopus microsporus]
MVFIKGPLAVDRRFPSLFSQTQTNLFKNTTFEASDGDFQETSLLRKGKNICITLKAAKADISAPGPKSAWPSTVDRIERYETIVNSFLTFWSTYDASNDADVLSEANLYAKPQCYMKWLHFIQKKIEQKKFIQEMKPQDKTSSSYVHRKLQELPFVKRLNTSKYRSLKENTLTAINSNKTLEITSKLKNIDKKDTNAVQNIIKTVQTRVQDKTFMPLKYTDPRGSRILFFTSLVQDRFQVYTD